jgi:hypothetical protein
MNGINVYLEIGAKRTLAGAIDWPGWCRSGRDEAAALAALYEYRPRYSRVVRGARLGFAEGFRPPAGPSELVVVERLKGKGTTDFGVPDIPPASDARPVDAAELRRLQAVLKACWRAFDAAAQAASAKELRRGPRGGGRDLPAITEHVLGAEAAYLSQLGWHYKPGERDARDTRDEDQARARAAVLEGLAAKVRGELPTRGPRGGLRWSARYFVRRDAWHVLDHAWEIEDRST